MFRSTSRICVISALLFISACSILRSDIALTDAEVADLYGYELEIELGIEQCKSVLAKPEPASSGELTSTGIQLLNWNIKKGEEQRWSEDLAGLSLDKNLVLLQEATVGMGLLDILSSMHHFSFSPGFVNRNEISGVATFSDIDPIGSCRLEAIEPWLGTPKSTNITRFALSQTSETLVVVNIHAINFSFGLADYRQQLEEVRDVLSVHEGPVVFSGDFNTWRKGRYEALQELTAELGARSVEFDVDHRVEFFGSTLDHIFVRGFEVLAASSYVVESSDHNPLSVSLRM